MLKDKRPFFSIIIPCYNSEKTIGRLLDSIVNQHISDDLEVIIVDDNSPELEKYVPIINQYTNDLNIKFITTDYNCCPGNTRQKGLSIASGEWITFADHDDLYIDDSLVNIKEEIENHHERYMVVSNFIEYNLEKEQILRKMEKTDNWMHGKFYNLDNFIIPFNLSFKKDLITHEDIYFSSKVKCIMHSLNIEPLYSDYYTYIWVYEPESISRKFYDNSKGFLENFFQDYINSTAEVYIDEYEHDRIDKEYAIVSSLATFLYVYFYIEGFKYYKPTTYDKTNITRAKDLLIKIMNKFSLNVDDVYAILTNNAYMYNLIRSNAIIGVGNFIESESISYFIDFLLN